jgi:hypothetical protein
MSNASVEDLARLTSIRHALLRLHKTLLDAQRVKYEREHGTVGSAGKLLELVISDPSFNWLHRISELIVQMDEAMEDKENPISTEALRGFVARTKALLTPAERAEDVFARSYFDALQGDANVGVVHGEVQKLLK